MASAPNIGQTHRDYDAKLATWKLARDVTNGEQAIKAEGTAYLPKLVDQTDTDYSAYKARASFFNASWRTVAGFVGMLFRKDPIITAPESLKKLLEDVTLTGVSLDNFARSLCYENLITSRVGVWVDYPTATSPDGQPLTQAAIERLNLRPTMSAFPAESILNWQFRVINNRVMLSQVRLLEKHTELADEFTENEEERIRVLDLDPNNEYRVRVFKKDSGEQVGPDVYPLMAGQRLTEIPFWFIGPDGVEATVEEPVLIDLFNLNIKHYQVSADYEHACHFTALPTPYVTGYVVDPAKPDTFYIGSTSAWVFPDPNAKVGFLEYSGQGIDAIEKNLAHKEEQMAAIGARMLAPEKAGVEAAETLVMRHSGEHSVLASISNAVSHGLTKALKVFAEWARAGSEVSIRLNREFIPFSAKPEEVKAWLAAVQAGRMSGETFFKLIQRGELVEPDVTFEEEQARIDSEAPALLPAPTGGFGASAQNPAQQKKIPERG